MTTAVPTVVDMTALEEAWSDDPDVSVAEILGVLAHEFRNPLASMQGCAQTLVERGEDVPAEVRRGLAEVIVRHAQRMDWLVRAAAAYGGVGGRVPAEIDLAEVVAAAGEVAEMDVDPGPERSFVADEKRLRLAIEALFLAVDATVASAGFSPDGVLEVCTSDISVGQAGRRWKLDLASRLLRAEGCELSIRRAEDEACVRVRFQITEGEGS